MQKNIVVLGASPKESRYSHRAVQTLLDKGFNPIPVHPTAEYISNIIVCHELKSVKQKVHTVTIYINNLHLETCVQQIIELRPARVIFNPGSESSSATKIFAAKGIEVVNACTLVMLSLDQF